MRIHTHTNRAADTQRPRPVPRPIRNPLALFLLAASKTDSRLVSVCSRWALSTQVVMGVFVCFTALLAFGAAYYTLSTLHVSGPWVLWIAVLYSLFIGTLDREIVGGLDKTTALVRPILSLFIGTIIAIPIELWVFQGRIDRDLQRQYRLDNKEPFDQLKSAEEKLDRRRAELQSE